MHYVINAIRDSRVLHRLGQQRRRSRSFFRRFHHHCIPASQRRRNFPGEQQQGQVPRRDHADDPQRLAHCIVQRRAHSRARNIGPPEFPSEKIPAQTFSPGRQRHGNSPPRAEHRASKPARPACPCPQLPPEQSSQTASRSHPRPCTIAPRAHELQVAPILRATRAAPHAQPHPPAPHRLQ